MTDNEVRLPELPSPDIKANIGGGWRQHAYSEMALRHFAIAAVMAERERCAKVCEAIAAPMFDHAKPPYLKAANAIRQPPEGGEG